MAWIFKCKMLQMEKSSGFRSDKYGGQSVGFQNSAMFFSQELLDGPGCVGRRQILLGDIVAIWICPLDPGHYTLPQKVLLNVSIDSFANSNIDNGIFLAGAAHHFFFSTV
jgi:hypothetical protein